MWDLQKYEQKTALIDETGHCVTYGEIAEAQARIAQAAGSRCLVVSLCTNTIGSVTGYVAFLNSRMVPIMLSAHMDNELMEHLLAVYSPSYIWCPVKEIVNHSGFGRMTRVLALYDYCLLKTDYPKTYPLYDELALLLTTSGSTGSPKFVRQSYANIKANMESIAAYLELDDTERPVTTLPMNYTYGLSVINSHLLVGATVLVTEGTLMQREFWQFFRKEEATSLAGVPYTYEMLERLRFMRMDLPSLRTMTQAGGKLMPRLHAAFADYAVQTGRKFVVMYGQCEATARMGYLPTDKASEKCGSMGIAIPGGKFTLIDINGEAVTRPYVTGELVYEGANVTLGYAECGADLALGDERGGILHTGDMAQFDEDGYYYIVGRKKRFLKIYGNRVNLDEIERIVKTGYEGIDCAAAGTDDHLFLFLTDWGIADDVRNFLAAKTGLNHAAFQVEVVEGIPKNDAGKILYKELEKYYLK